MPDIVTITFSPCIDRSAAVPTLIPEKKLTCSRHKLEPGGGGINVARAIKKLGGDVIAVYPAGGYTGMHFNKLLSEENIAAIIVETIQETRENVIILDEANNSQYRFGMPANPLMETEWRHMLDAIIGMENVEFIVASGSLPPGVPDDIFRQIAIVAKRKKIKLVVDTSGEPLKYAVEEGVYLLKPNLRELSSLVGKEKLNEDEIVQYASQLIHSGKAAIIMASMGEKGALLVTEDTIKLITPPLAKKKSTVGAGDSMVAGMVLALSRGMSVEESAVYGVACGTAATLNPGTELCKKEDADRFFEQLSYRSSLA
jgi:6-phosphofructokinase 2